MTEVNAIYPSAAGAGCPVARRVVAIVRKVVNHGSISVGFGQTEDGQPIRFAGESRPMADVAAAIAQGEEPLVELEDWQVLG